MQNNFKVAMSYSVASFCRTFLILSGLATSGLATRRLYFVLWETAFRSLGVMLPPIGCTLKHLYILVTLLDLDLAKGPNYFRAETCWIATLVLALVSRSRRDILNESLVAMRFLTIFTYLSPISPRSVQSNAGSFDSSQCYILLVARGEILTVPLMFVTEVIRL